MIATNHALTGAAVAAVVQQPLLAVPIAFASHFVCDAIPHFGIDLQFRSRAMYIWLIIDGLAALCMAGYLLLLGVNNPVLLAFCGFVAMSPDLAWLHYGVKQQLGKSNTYDPVTRFHHNIQWYQKVPGLAVEIIWAVMMVGVIVGLQPT